MGIEYLPIFYVFICFAKIDIWYDTFIFYLVIYVLVYENVSALFLTFSISVHDVTWLM